MKNVILCNIFRRPTKKVLNRVHTKTETPPLHRGSEGATKTNKESDYEFQTEAENSSASLEPGSGFHSVSIPFLALIIPQL